MGNLACPDTKLRGSKLSRGALEHRRDTANDQGRIMPGATQPPLHADTSHACMSYGRHPAHSSARGPQHLLMHQVHKLQDVRVSAERLSKRLAGRGPSTLRGIGTSRSYHLLHSDGADKSAGFSTPPHDPTAMPNCPNNAWTRL